MRVNDAVSGLILMLFAAAMLMMASQFPGFPGQNYGPGLFPMVLGFGILLCGGILTARGLVAHFSDGQPWWLRDPAGSSFLSFALIVGSVLFYIFASDTVGFILSSLAILLALFARFRVRWRVALPVAIGTTLAMQYFFVNLMRVPLARGWLDSVL